MTVDRRDVLKTGGAFVVAFSMLGRAIMPRAERRNCYCGPTRYAHAEWLPRQLTPVLALTTGPTA